MAAHDQRFKMLLQAFLREFLVLFFPDLVDQLDLDCVEWLHQELYPDPPKGQLLTIDLIARIPLQSTAAAKAADASPQTILLHLEFEADDKVEPFRARLHDYFYFLIRKHGPRVLPIAVYLRVGLEGQGKDCHVITVLGRTVARFEYDYIGLPALPGQQFLASGNPLGVALSALMRWPRAQRAKAAVQALEWLVASQETSERKHMLCECVQAYAPLEDEQCIELNTLLRQPQREGVWTMIKTWSEEAEERGIKEGIKQGQLQGRRESVLDQLEAKFPGLSPAVRERVAHMSEDKLRQLSLDLLTAETLRELRLED